MKIRSEKILLYLLILSICFSSTAFAGETNIVRDVSTLEPNSDSEFTVTLKISGTDAAGIIENIPEGFSYIGSDHPEIQIRQSGSRITFSVIGETEISYQVKAPASGEGTFRGVWYNPINETEGIIVDTNVSVNDKIHTTQNSVNALASENGSQDTETKSSPFAGIGLSVVVIALTGCYLRGH